MDAPSAWGHEGEKIFVRQQGRGVPILLLHGGWGYGVHSFDTVASELSVGGFHCIAPDRSGYGRSTSLERLPLDFHRRAAREMGFLLDALGIGQALLWGHSDGAVIAAWMAIQEPKRFPAVILESFHLWSQKLSSRLFFETTSQGGHTLPERTKVSLETDHGDGWSDVVAKNGRVWVELGEGATGPHADLYGGGLGQIKAKTLLLYGSGDPRMEPREVEAAQRGVAGSELVVVEGRHVPHAEPQAWTKARQRILSFLGESALALGP